MQDKEFIQEIEELIDIQDMEVESEPHNQDIDMIPCTQ